jgi:hypothetical protein
VFTLKIAASLIIATLLAGCDSASDKNDETGDAELAAKSGMTKDFFDPGAVQYRDVQVKGEPGNYTFCGELNGKNRYGAFTGFKRFIAIAVKKNGAYTYSFSHMEGEIDDFDQRWRLFCRP